MSTLPSPDEDQTSCGHDAQLLTDIRDHGYGACPWCELDLLRDTVQVVAEFCIRVAEDPEALEQHTIGHSGPHAEAMYERRFVAKCVLDRLGASQ
jgi:hypothetical protein